MPNTEIVVAITAQPEPYQVSLINAISTRGRVHADFATATEAFAYARENRAYFNNTIVRVRKVIGSVTRTETVYPTKYGPGESAEITRQVVAVAEINDLTAVGHLETLGNPSCHPAAQWEGHILCDNCKEAVWWQPA